MGEGDSFICWILFLMVWSIIFIGMKRKIWYEIDFFVVVLIISFFCMCRFELIELCKMVIIIYIIGG